MVLVMQPPYLHQVLGFPPCMEPGVTRRESQGALFKTTAHNPELICIVSNVGVPKVVSAFWIKGPHLLFQLEAFRTAALEL